MIFACLYIPSTCTCRLLKLTAKAKFWTLFDLNRHPCLYILNSLVTKLQMRTPFLSGSPS